MKDGWFKTLLCPFCGNDTVKEVYGYASYLVYYDNQGDLQSEEYEKNYLEDYRCWNCESDIIVTIEVEDVKTLIQLNQLRGLDRLIYALKLIKEGKARVTDDSLYTVSIDNNIKLLKFIIEHHKNEKVKEVAKEVLKEIAPREVIDLL